LKGSSPVHYRYREIVYPVLISRTIRASGFALTYFHDATSIVYGSIFPTSLLPLKDSYTYWMWIIGFGNVSICVLSMNVLGTTQLPGFA
jgi:hypothetical protein